VANSLVGKEFVMKLKWRPQILVAIIILGSIAIYGITQGMVEVGTGCIGGIIALGMKLLEGE